MLFNSYQFLLFFVIVTSLYFVLPHKIRWLLLLVSSCIFYMAFIPSYVLILFLTIFIDYFAGILIEKVNRRKKLFLIMSILANVGVLCVFKYYNFFIGNTNEFLHSINITTRPIPLLHYILPLGLSFHTFQAMSYTIEVYRGKQKAERHIGIYALYVMFYPQLVAGPIERPQNLIHQFKEKHYFNADRVNEGLRLMLWGMFKKVVIADRLAYFTGFIFATPHNYPAISLVIASIMFSFQIFCDFSGYSDIAIGSAKVMGFKLMTNFNWPYASKSIQEFWTRWHISLSTWFKDYIYIPLGGNRVPLLRWYFNLSVVFLISGLWHGANWTFIVWGGLHGFCLIITTLVAKARNYSDSIHKPRKSKIIDIGGVLFTFGIVTIAWVFFRATTVSDAFYIISRFPRVFKDIYVSLYTHNIAFWNIWGKGESKAGIYFVISIILIIGLMLFHSQKIRTKIFTVFKGMNFILRFLIYYLVLLIILLSFIDIPPSSFIYFQF